MNVFEAGVVISLYDHASGALANIAREFGVADKAATALQSQLNKIGKTFMAGAFTTAAGLALAKPLIDATKEATEYEHQLNRMKTAGLSNVQMAEAIGTAWKTTNSVITSTALENLKVVMDLRSVFGEKKGVSQAEALRESLDYMPLFAKMQGAYSGVLDGKMAGRADEMAFAMAKTLDMMGRVSNAAEFDQQAKAMFKVVPATGGRVTPEDYLSTMKYARQAKYGFDDNFLYKLMPELILENKQNGGTGGGARGLGPQLAAVYRWGVQGVMSKRSAQELVNLQLINAAAIQKTSTTGTMLANGGVRGADTLSKNPFQWVNETFIPALAKHYHINPSDSAKLIEASNQIFKGNQGAASLIAELIKKRQQYTRFPAMYDKAMGLDDAYNQAMKNDPETNWKALDASFKNVRTAIGEQILPSLIPMVNSLASGLQQLGSFLHNHAGITKALIAINGLAAGALVLGGSALMAKAAFMGLQLVFSALAGGTSGGIALVARGVMYAIPLVARLGTLLLGGLGGPPMWAAIAAVAGVSLVVANWDKIMGFVHNHFKFFIHIAAEAVRAAQALGNAISGLVASMRTGFAQLRDQAMKIPGVKQLDEGLNNASKGIWNGIGAFGSGISKGIHDAIESSMKVDEVTAKRDENLLRQNGMGGLVDAIKASKPSNTVNNITPVIHINATTNADPKEIAKQVATEVKKQVGKVVQQAGASSGNSTGNSLYTRGNHRP